jgi:hypothetical protein
MLVLNSGPDAASRAALRLLMRQLPGLSAVHGSVDIETSTLADQPQLRAAQNVEGSVLRARKIPNVSRGMSSGFAAFLDGTQRVRIVGHYEGIPLVFGLTAAAIRTRANRRLTAWGHQRPAISHKLYLPLKYLPPLSAIGLEPEGENAMWPIVDTSAPDSVDQSASQHPAAMVERAIRAIDRDRESLEDQLAEAWCARAETPIFIDGGISRSERVAKSERAIGVIKSHRTLYVEGPALRVVLCLAKGERSSVFRVSPRLRNSVMSWYLRLHSHDGHDALWGLVRVEMSECNDPTERADEISRWILAETNPLALPDGRWDKMSYGIRDVEEFLRAIS